MHDYFCDYGPYHGRISCGDMKRTAMRLGPIILSGYNSRPTTLRFFRRPVDGTSTSQTSDYRLNNLISSMLSWLKARYQSAPPEELTADSAQPPPRKRQRSVPPNRTLDDEFLYPESSADTTGEEAESSTRFRNDEKERKFAKMLAEHYKEMARCLDTHDVFVDLLRKALRNINT